FYMRKITLTTVRVTIRPGLPHLATAPFVRPPLFNIKRKLINKTFYVSACTIGEVYDQFNS
ncbi:unnamed protein product, partial [Heterotrigona itama]